MNTAISRLRLPSTALCALALVAATGCERAPEAPSAAAAATPRPERAGVPMDGLPAGRAAAPESGWSAEVAPGGELTLVAPSGERRTLDHEVRAELSFSPDGARLAWARQAEGEDSDVFVAEVSGGEPRLVTGWPGAEDRPLFSPDGDALLVVSGRTGIASLWWVPLDGAEPVQLTNVGLEDQPRRPGHPPDGFVPPPETGDWAWTADGVTWSAEGRTWTLPPGDLRDALTDADPRPRVSP